MRARLRLCLVAWLCSSPLAAANDVLIENVTLLSPELAQPLGNRHVLVRGGRIAEISRQPIAAEPALPRLDGSGKYLSPGLMDSHVHVSTAPGLPDSDEAGIVALRAAFVRQQPRSYLYHGITQLLDPANFPAPLAAFKAQPQRPDLFHCGAVPVLNGYPSVFLPAEHRHREMPNFLHEPANPDPLPPRALAEQHTPEAVVAAVKASGAHCIKLFLEDGFGDASGWPLARVETLRRVNLAARREGLPVLAHANALDMQRLAIDAGVDVLAHGLWNWTGIDGAEGIPPAVAALNQRIHEQAIGLQPTLRVMPGLTALLDPATLDNPAYLAVVPPDLLAWYRTPAAQWFARELAGDLPPAQRAGLMRLQRRKADQARRALRDLHERGHPLLLASDTPAAPTYVQQPGYNTFQEMLLMAEAGVSLVEIFRAGTLNNARQFGLEQDYGTIEVGKIANLLLLDANPLSDVRHWDRIDRVVLHGLAIKRERLRANRTPPHQADPS